MKTLEDEWHVVIKAYKFTNFNFLVLSMGVCTLLTYKIYRLYSKNFTKL